MAFMTVKMLIDKGPGLFGQTSLFRIDLLCAVERRERVNNSKGN